MLFIVLWSIMMNILVPENKMNELLEKLIFNAVSVLVGLSIAVAGIFLGSINSLYLSIYKIMKTKNESGFSDKEIHKMKTGLSGIVDELKDNAIFSIVVFMIVLFLFFIKEIKIPNINCPIHLALFSKMVCINSIILIGTFLIFYSIYDSIYVVFKITKAFELMKDE